MEVEQADPELIRQLRNTLDEGQSVAVVCSLHPSPAPESPSAAQTTQRVNEVLARVRQQTGQTPGEVTVFGNLGAFLLSAPPRFVWRLLAQPEVATATANQQPNDLFIRPVRGASGRVTRRKKGSPRPDDSAASS